MSFTMPSKKVAVYAGDGGDELTTYMHFCRYGHNGVMLLILPYRSTDQVSLAAEEPQ